MDTYVYASTVRGSQGLHYKGVMELVQSYTEAELT